MNLDTAVARIISVEFLVVTYGSYSIKREYPRVDNNFEQLGTFRQRPPR